MAKLSLGEVLGEEEVREDERRESRSVADLEDERRESHTAADLVTPFASHCGWLGEERRMETSEE